MYRLNVVSSKEFRVKGANANGPCEGRNLGGIVCVVEVHLSPKLLSDPAWVVTHSKWVMNLSMDYESH